MRKSRFLAGLAAVALGATAFPASAQTSPVDVLLENPGGTRVLHVENLDGTRLEALDFGTSRSLPFRVRVVDDAFDREDFAVDATMTNLYRVNESTGAVDYSLAPIASEKVALGSASAPGALEVKAVIQPVLDTVTTLTDPIICNLLGFTPLNLLDGCTISGTDVLGQVTELVATPELLAQLPKLPLVPQAVETGSFEHAEYGAGVGADRGPADAADPTALQVLGGDASPVDLSALTTLANAVPDADLVDAGALLGELGQTLPVSNLLPAQLATLLASTTATVQALSLADILSQTGTYLSLPTLNVDDAGAAPGDYKGTLVITALQ